MAVFLKSTIFAPMKEFLQILRRFVPPYKKYLGLSVLFNILSAVLNIFSFAALIPILQILFQVDGGIRANDYMEWDGSFDTVKEVATNNLYYYIQEFIVAHSASLALLVIGLFLAFMTFLKTGAYFHYYPYPYRYRPRYPQPALSEDHLAFSWFLQRGAQGRYHRPNER